MTIISIETLQGYDEEIETARQEKFDEFTLAKGPAKKRRAFESLASLTALRSSTFVANYERALGLRGKDDE